MRIPMRTVVQLLRDAVYVLPGHENWYADPLVDWTIADMNIEANRDAFNGMYEMTEQRWGIFKWQPFHAGYIVGTQPPAWSGMGTIYGYLPASR